MSNIDIAVILIFTLLVFICGMSFSKAGKNMKSYFAAGGALPWWMSGLSLFMSFFSAGTFVVWGSIAYSSGWVAVTIQWTMCIAGVIIGFFIAPKWQKTIGPGGPQKGPIFWPWRAKIASATTRHPSGP